MNYSEFKIKVQRWPVISTRDLLLNEGNKQIVRNQLERWHRKKLVIKLKRSMYMLNATDRRIEPSRSYIANQLYSPSYVSLEYAMGYYDLIPERVSDITCITTRKTKRFTNEVGVFLYQHVKPAAFRGFTSAKDESGMSFLLAEAEKALVDFCYFNTGRFKKDIEGVFRESLRLQNIEDLSTVKVMKFARLFKNDKLTRLCRVLCGLIEKDGGK